MKRIIKSPEPLAGIAVIVAAAAIAAIAAIAALPAGCGGERD